jgi:hypothetical protein
VPNKRNSQRPSQPHTRTGESLVLDEERERLRTWLQEGAQSAPGVTAHADYFASLRAQIQRWPESTRGPTPGG